MLSQNDWKIIMDSERMQMRLMGHIQQLSATKETIWDTDSVTR